MSKTMLLALALCGLALVSAGPKTTFKVTLYTGINNQGASWVFNGSFPDAKAANRTVLDFAGLYAQLAKGGKVALNNAASSLKFEVTGPSKGLVKLVLFDLPCKNWTAGSLNATYGAGKATSLKNGLTKKASGLAVLMVPTGSNVNSFKFGAACGNTGGSTSGGPKEVDCNKNPSHPSCSTPQSCCVNSKTGEFDVFGGKCPGAWKTVDCAKHRRMARRLNAKL